VSLGPRTSTSSRSRASGYLIQLHTTPALLDETELDRPGAGIPQETFQ
jgi:hypothetical protein